MNRYGVCMRLRTLILLTLLFSHSVSALGLVWQSGLAAQGDPVAEHCDSMPESVSNESQQLQGDSSDSDAQHSAHEDCSVNCSMCAACAAGLTAEFMTAATQDALVRIAIDLGFAPAGTQELLYRPPIIS